MPTYDYRCKACEHAFEHFQAISEPLLRKCPACGKPKLERLIGAGAGLLFKGSGFYITDYRSSGYAEAAKKEGGGDAKPAGASGATGEAGAKPAAPTDSSAKKTPAAKPPASGKSPKKKS